MKLRDMAGGHEFFSEDSELVTPWENLCNAVVMAAVNDYRNALKTIVLKEKWLESPEAQEADAKKRARAEGKIVACWHTVKEVEDFFRSERVRVFTQLDMETIGKQIRAEFPEAKTVRKKPWRGE